MGGKKNNDKQENYKKLKCNSWFVLDKYFSVFIREVNQKRIC